jgi:predicted alpha/beta hydrolase family esterase
MRRKVLFVQGGGEGAHQEDATLVANLAKELGADYEVHYPVMPHEDSPDYPAWNRILIEQLACLGDDVILVAHSVGATIVVWSLAENRPKQKVAGVFLIAAPFVGERGWQIEEFTPPKDIGAKLPDVPIYLYHGREDEIVPFAHVDLYAAVLPQAFIRRLPRRNHQLNNDLSEVARDICSLNAPRAP